MYNISEYKFVPSAFPEYVLEGWLRHWPVVYLINNDKDVYIGETTSAIRRFNQHLRDPRKSKLKEFRVINDSKFNKSVTLDLESYLIDRFFADGKYSVLNRNRGMPQHDYYNKSLYISEFPKIFNELKDKGLFSKSLNEIENDDLFRLSPFKTLNADQLSASVEILKDILEARKLNSPECFVVSGDPGTGKTVIAIFLIKFLNDLSLAEYIDYDQMADEFASIISSETLDNMQNLKIGFVIPQKSLRETIKKVFRKVDGLSAEMVIDPFKVGESPEIFDLLIVDEAHRLGRRSNQSSAVNNRRFKENNIRLFGEDRYEFTQLDWIKDRSKIQILLIDKNQGIKNSDLSEEQLEKIISQAIIENKFHLLKSQMRINSPQEYINWISDVLSGKSPKIFNLGEYDFRFFDSINEMKNEIESREREFQLSRLLAGYAWDWNKKEKNNPNYYDIEIEDEYGIFKMKWNSKDSDWVHSINSKNEVGSIYTIQGYDLNYAGVIIGKDLRMDPDSKKVFYDKNEYKDKKAKEGNNKLNISFTNEDFLVKIKNIYKVLLTRGVHGTYVYVCDPVLRDFFKNNFQNLLESQSLYNGQSSDFSFPKILDVVGVRLGGNLPKCDLFSSALNHN
ncbi:DUF2075 domain-containing protein [Rothia aerolata]|uniref:ATP/GTP-binding protein n=1 Tax=Rothia aerolata TaxID=1812262 RepID=A0A917MSK9_9MICC|nr:DUF2075 domain-containing protein [Rothia aerolata]GGH58207.1 ATP/GTP-binding protein [Rothia aerolata]